MTIEELIGAIKECASTSEDPDSKVIHWDDVELAKLIEDYSIQVALEGHAV